MGCHHSLDASFDECVEGVEVDGVDVFLCVVDDRKVEMAVGLGVAVSGKMLRHSHNPLALEATHIGDSLLRHRLSILAERAHADDGVLGVGVEVNHRGEVDMHPQLPALASDFGSHLLNEIVILVRHGTHKHLLGEGIAVFQSHPKSVLGIGGDEEGHFRD